jgi:hypothetical protein
VWDTIKAGAGAISYVSSFIVDGFGLVIDALHSVIDLATELPDAIKPDWIDDFAKGLDKTAEKSHEIGESMRNWGKGTFNNFGKSAGDVDKWFNNLEARMNEKPEKKKRGGGLAGDDVEIDAGKNMFAGAFEKGTKEAYQVIARYQTGQLADQKDEAKKQTTWLEKISNHLDEMKRQQAEYLPNLDSEGDF